MLHETIVLLMALILIISETMKCPLQVQSFLKITLLFHANTLHKTFTFSLE